MNKLLLIFLALLPALAWAAGSSSNTVTWDYVAYDMVGNPASISATLVLRKADACASAALAFTQIASVPFPALNYDDVAIKAGSTYCYELQSQTPAGTSAMSNQVAKTVPFVIGPVPGNVIVK